MARGEVRRRAGKPAENGASATPDELAADEAVDPAVGSRGSESVDVEANGHQEGSEEATGESGSDEVSSDETAAAQDDEAVDEQTASPASYPAEDPDPAETDEWLESLRYVIQSKGPERASYLLSVLEEAAYREGVEIPFSATTPYINTIPPSKQPLFPGNREIERRIKSIIRWNAMAMVVRANKESAGIGGHISTYASAATLYEVAFNHFFRGRSGDFTGDQIYFQGHASPGIYARAFLEGRLERNANWRISAASWPRAAAYRRTRIPG